MTGSKNNSFESKIYARFGVKIGVKVTPKRIKPTHVRSKNNSIFRVILTPDCESK